MFHLKRQTLNDVSRHQ